MTRNIIVLLVLCLLRSTTLSGQCPDSVLLWKRLVFFADSPNAVPNSRQLSELLNDESELKACPVRFDSTYAFLLLGIGICYINQADYQKAIQYIRQSIHIISSHYESPSIRTGDLPVCYYKLSVCYDSLNDVTDKKRAVDSCMTIGIRINSIDKFTLYCLNLNLVYAKDIGDYEKCIRYAKIGEMLTVKFRQDFNNIQYFLRFLEWEVDALLVLKKYDEAEKILSHNLHSFQIEECKKEKAWGYLSTLYEQFAEVLAYNKKYDSALFWFNQSIYYDEKSDNFLGCLVTMENIGHILYFRQRNDLNMSINCYNKALLYGEKAIKTGTPRDLPFIRIELLNLFDNIAISYQGKGLYDSAMFFFQKGFDQIKPGMNESILLQSSEGEFLQNKSMLYSLSMIIDKAEAVLKWGETSGNIEKVREAVHIFKIADKLLSRLKSDQTEIQSKLFWRNDSRRLYDHAIEASFVLGNESDAFYFFEKSRAVLLGDQLNQLTRLNNADILEQARIRKKTVRFEMELNNTERSSKRYEEIQTELFRSKQESDRLEQMIKQNNPLYYQTFFDTSFITSKDVKDHLLDNHQALLELFSGDSSIYSLLMTRQKVYFNRINKTDFDSTVDSYVSYISNPELLNRRFDDYIKSAGHLYHLIFQNNPVPVGRIIVSPDGQIFPFEALVANVNFTTPVYFLNDHAVSYTYSARYLLTHFAADTSKGNDIFLGVAPVRYPSSSLLADLKGSDYSLIQIGSYFQNAHNLITADATRDNFRQQFSDYKIIQLYSHASDTSSRGEPVLYFADSSLYLSDLIPENKPKTRLIVLSACETGNGILYKGEGVFSFNRGFASLGIPSSITNLWSVDNLSTYRITELFYKYVSEGIPIDIALQKAKLEFIETGSKKNSMPYYWAAAVLTGKSDAIEYNKNFPWKDIMTITSLVGLAFFVRQKGKKRKN